MKKAVVFLLLFSALSVPSVFAAERGTAEYERLKEVKKAQREKREHEKKAAADPSVPREKSFWQKEAERSGFAGTGAMFSNAVAAAIPLDRPNSRKPS